MSGSGYRTWTPGENVTADNLNNYLQKQVIIHAADATAVGLLSGEKGFRALDLATLTEYEHDGSNWVAIFHHKRTSWTPQLYLGGVNYASVTVVGSYARAGALLTVAGTVTLTGTPGAGTLTIANLPVSPAGSGPAYGMGSFFFNDANANNDVIGVAYPNSGQLSLVYSASATTATLLNGTSPVAMVSTDTIDFSCTYFIA